MTVPQKCISHSYVDDTKLQISFKLQNKDIAVAEINDDLCKLCNWCFRNYLLLNPDKSKLMVFGTTKMLPKLHDITLSLLGKDLLPTIHDKSLGPLADFCSICQGNFIISPPSPQFNVVYQDEFVIARFQHCRGGRGFLIPVMSLVIVSKIACQCMFQLSDPNVPRTFVEDCICVTKSDNDMLSGQSYKKVSHFVLICYDIAFGSRNKCFTCFNFSRFMILYTF